MNWKPFLNYSDAAAIAKIYQKIRSFFLQRNVIEIQTPLMGSATVTDVYIDPIEAKYENGLKETKGLKYLQTSPEYAMKRLLASGYGDIYQLCKAFRSEIHGRHHNPEFTILEWYRLDYDHHQLMHEVDEFLQCILQTDTAEYISYVQLFKNTVAIDPTNVSTEELISVLTTYHKFSEWLSNESIDTLLQVIFSEIIEPTIGANAPCFVYDFPASQASLARLNDDNSAVASRFECYYKGLELANGFHELTDATIQESRFISDNVKRKQLNKPERVLDRHFLRAIQHGLPDCAGVALGVDRLLMLALNKATIAEVLTFDITNA